MLLFLYRYHKGRTRLLFFIWKGDGEVEQKDYECLAKTEAQVGQMSAVVIRMEAKLDTWATNFLTRNEAAEMFRSRDQDIQETRQELKELKSEKQSDKALCPAWIGAAVAVIALVVSMMK